MKIFLIILSFIFFFVSCYEDKGNYDYVEVKKVLIQFIEPVYNIQKTKTLTISPVLESDIGDESSFEYSWEINGTTVSTEKNLNYVVVENVIDESYLCRFTVINGANMTKFYQEFSLNVTTPYTKGLVVLLESNENIPVVDFITVDENDIYTEIVHDVYKLENGVSLEGKPLQIEDVNWTDWPGDLFIHTTRGAHCLISNFMKNATTFDGSSMLSPIENFEMVSIDLYNYNDAGYGATIGKDGRIYPMRDMDQLFSLPSLYPCPISDDLANSHEYELSEHFIAITVGWGNNPSGLLTYDNKSKRFLRFMSVSGTGDKNQMARVQLKDEIGGIMFYMNSVNYNSGFCSLLHDGSYSGWQVIPLHSATYDDNTSVYNMGENYLKQNSIIVIDPSLSIMYYSSDSKLYKVFLTDTAKKFDSEEFLIEGLKNEDITMLKFKNWKAEILYVGVKDKVYEVDMVTKKVINTFKINGIPKDVHYKS